MSTKLFGPNKAYKIGTIGWEGTRRISQILDVIVPTYGLWAGPGWAGGFRVKSSEDIAWKVTACYNETIADCEDIQDEDERAGHYSLVDAICKKHDWGYYHAECNKKDSAEIIKAADLALLCLFRFTRTLIPVLSERCFSSSPSAILTL